MSIAKDMLEEFGQFNELSREERKERRKRRKERLKALAVRTGAKVGRGLRTAKDVTVRQILR